MSTSDNKNANSTILVVGATSSLAQALCRSLATRGHALLLAGRDPAEMTLLADDLIARFGIPCRMVACDLLAADFSPQSLIDGAGDFDTLVIAAGDMGDGDKSSPQTILHTALINYILPAQIAAVAAERMREKKCGQVVLIGSVAGDRGRQSNYAYGSAKAALATFASGLRNSLAHEDVHVMTVKPGFVDTPMTWGMTSPLIASREYVAESIAKAMEKRKDVIYVPWFWQLIMLIIIHIPERIFKKLKL